jgi:hypothetical protein
VSPVLTASLINAQWSLCNLDGSSCFNYKKILQKGENYNFEILVGQKIIFYNGLLSSAKYYSWESRGKLYSLINQENGAIIVGNQGSCYISDSLKHKVVAESPNPIPKGFTNCQNYFINFVQVATKTYLFNGRDSVCLAKQIYGIDKQKLEDGSSINMQGEKVASVECCPQEPNCDATTFKFKTSVTRECTYSYECANEGNPYPSTQTTAKYYICENQKCVQKIKSVECTSDAVCIQRHGSGYVCDLTPSNYGNCKEAPTGAYCGDGYCDVGESKSTCSEDCELECMEGEKLITITKKIPSAICPLGLFGVCEEKTEKSCEGGLNWYKVIAIILGLLIFVYILSFIIKPLGALRKSLLKH